MESTALSTAGSQIIGEVVKEVYDSDKCMHLSIPAEPLGSSLSQAPRVFTLADISDEILQLIFNRLADEDLYQVALISRRFNEIAIPTFLWRHGSSSYLLLFNYITKDLVRALFSAVFRPKLHAVQYVVDCWKTAAELTAEIALVTRILQTVDGLAMMILNFANTGPPLRKAIQNASVPAVEDLPEQLDNVDIPTGYGFPAGIEAGTVHAFLDAIASSGCQMFVMQHCTQQRTAQGVVADWIRDQFGGLQGLRRRLSSWLPPSISGRRVPQQHALNTFSLNSPMAFHPLVMDWTLGTLNFSRITTLAIEYHQATDSDAWVYILPHIFVQALTTLSVDFAKMPPETLVSFLHRHPTLKSLFIGQYVPLPDDDLSFPFRALPNLTHFTVPREWCNVLLRPPGALPSLVSPTIAVRVPYFRQLDFIYPMLSYLPCMPRLLMSKEVRLSLSFAFSTFDWLLDSPSKNNATSQVGGEASPLTTSVTDSHIGLLRMVVTHLNLYIMRDYCPAVLARGLYLWLGRFPRLKHLRMYTLGSPEQITASYSGQFLRESVKTMTGVSTVRFAMFQKN